MNDPNEVAAIAAVLDGLPPATAAASIRLARLETPLGPLLGAADDAAILLLEFPDPARLRRQLAALRRHCALPLTAGGSPLLARLQQELDDYFGGRLRRFSLPLRFPGTPLQQRLWQALTELPHGQTRSYEAMAAQLGLAGASRAVGTCNGLNRLAILVPCHRLVNKGGGLGGYGGGLWRKQRLLALEAANR